MARRLEYFFDYVSPYSYLADSQVPALVHRTGAELVHRPFLLGGVMKSAGNSPPATVAAKARYMPADIARWLRRYGLAFEFNPHFPVNTVKAMRGALAALEQGVFPAYHAALFRAMWREKQDLGDEAVLRAVIEGAGLDAGAILARAGEDAVKERLRANTDEAVARGSFGAPTFFVGDEMFFGNDRLDFVEEALKG
jgi:2-hydroxychromene-2-carboxylate isomerase